ncbi:hypothetical protein VNO78_15384 [Psophocarpus tetragonolobus]|uniref:RING-type E3 ubiquitin transferase n=1 Tax=Psophocarpus tetragonolobus TaxID=3891 RepID=A0AAN9XJV4_PSOTE
MATLFYDADGDTFLNHMVYIYIAVAHYKPKSLPTLCYMQLPYAHDILHHASYCNNFVNNLLKGLSVPRKFFIGHDCDMVQTLSTWLCNSILQRPRVDVKFFRVFIMVRKTRCDYKVVSTPFFFQGEEALPSKRFVKRMACKGGKHCFPAGATTLEIIPFHGQEDECPICFKPFNFHHPAARLPCSHAFHNHCVLAWFVKKATCPICRYACTPPS